MKKYIVSMLRISYALQDIPIEANSMEEAADKALDIARNFEYSEFNAVYEVEGVLKKENQK